jgi:hypothetical protein
LREIHQVVAVEIGVEDQIGRIARDERETPGVCTSCSSAARSVVRDVRALPRTRASATQRGERRDVAAVGLHRVGRDAQ